MIANPLYGALVLKSVSIRESLGGSMAKKNFRFMIFFSYFILFFQIGA